MDKLDAELNSLAKENKRLRLELDQLKKKIVQDDTSKRSSQELQLAELIIDNSNAVLFRRLAADDPKKRKMVYVSPNISRFGYQAEDFLNDKVMFRDLVYPEDSPRTLQEIQSFVEQGIESYTQHYRIVTSKGEVRWVEDRTSIYEDEKTGLKYHQGIVIDVHEKRKAEEKLQRSEEKYRRIIETTGEGFILLDESFKIIDLNCAYTQMVKRSRSELVGREPFEIASEIDPKYWFYKNSNTEISQSRELECEIIDSNGKKTPVLIHASALRSDNDEIMGTVAFITDISAHKKALQLAAEVQKGLFPTTPPSLVGLDIAGISLPCDEVGGDYFDYLSWPVNDDSISVVIGDISGHGVDSALLMSSARACLRVRTSQPGSLEENIRKLNRHLINDVRDSGRFMTLFFLTIQRKTKTMKWIRAGHDPALLYDPVDNLFKELRGPGIALGIDKDFPYQTQCINDLQLNQIIVLSTDGIWEANNIHGEIFGKERVREMVRKNAAKSAEKILNEILAAHSHFTEGVASEDDLTLIIIKII